MPRGGFVSRRRTQHRAKEWRSWGLRCSPYLCRGALRNSSVSKKPMRSLLLALFVLSLGCAGTVYATKPEDGHGPYRHIPAPIWPEANVNGPLVEHSRTTGWSNFAISSAALAVAGNQYSYAGAAAASSVTAASATFEYYKSDDVQEFIKKLLEDTGTVTRIYPEAKGWDIKGQGGVPYRTCGACTAQYIFMAFIPPLWMIGIPAATGREANIELRVYHDHDFIRSYVGTGACTAFGTVWWMLWTHNAWSHTDGSVNGCAVGAAAADGVRKLQDDPPTLDDAATGRPER
jgi:hypothetical protein